MREKRINNDFSNFINDERKMRSFVKQCCVMKKDKQVSLVEAIDICKKNIGEKND